MGKGSTSRLSVRTFKGRFVRFSLPLGNVVPTAGLGLVAILQRSCCAEEVTTPEYRSFHWSSHRDTTAEDRLPLDGTWENN